MAALLLPSGSSPVPTAGNEALAPDLDGPMDRAALMRGRVERPAQLVWIDHGRAAIVLEIPSTVPMRGLGTITYTESADVIACTFWDSDVVILCGEVREPYPCPRSGPDASCRRRDARGQADPGRMWAGPLHRFGGSTHGKTDA